MVTIDCNQNTISELNEQLRGLDEGTEVQLLNPAGNHNIAVGLEQFLNIDIAGHTGYYCGGMNKSTSITIKGNAGQGVGENMMSGKIRVHGYASASAGASAHGGQLIIEKDTAVRCGVSLKGADIVVGGSVGNMCGFMAQAGTILICGDAGEALGDSIYEAVIYLRGNAKSYGADAREEPMTEVDLKKVEGLLVSANREDLSPDEFKRIASAKTLYHFDANKAQTY